MGSTLDRIAAALGQGLVSAAAGTKQQQHRRIENHRTGGHDPPVRARSCGQLLQGPGARCFRKPRSSRIHQRQRKSLQVPMNTKHSARVISGQRGRQGSSRSPFSRRRCSHRCGAALRASTGTPMKLCATERCEAVAALGNDQGQRVLRRPSCTINRYSGHHHLEGISRWCHHQGQPPGREPASAPRQRVGRQRADNSRFARPPGSRLTTVR